MAARVSAAAEPKPAAGVHTLFVGATCLVFSEPRQELHALNDTAGLLWCHFEAGGGAAAVAAAAAAYALDAPAASALLASALADWRRRGLLAGAGSPRRRRAPMRVPAPLDGPSAATPEWVAEHRYALLDSCVAVRFSAPAQAAAVGPVLGHLAVAGREPDAIIEIRRTARGLALYRGGARCGRCGGVDALAPLVKGLVWAIAVNRCAGGIGIHAGAVAGPHGAVLLPGPAGSGKSSLTAALVHAGYAYFSDELALLSGAPLTIRPVPLPICVKAAGIEALAGRFPELRALPTHRRADGKTVVYLRPPGSVPEPGAARTVRAIVFPRYGPGASNRLHRLGPAEALVRLLAECVVVLRPLDPLQVRELIALVQDADCFELPFDALTCATVRIAECLR